MHFVCKFKFHFILIRFRQCNIVSWKYGFTYYINTTFILTLQLSGEIGSNCSRRQIISSLLFHCSDQFHTVFPKLIKFGLYHYLNHTTRRQYWTRQVKMSHFRTKMDYFWTKICYFESKLAAFEDKFGLTFNLLPFSSVSKTSFSVVPTRVPFGFRNSSFSDSESSSWPLSKNRVRLFVQFLTFHF